MSKKTENPRSCRWTFNKLKSWMMENYWMNFFTITELESWKYVSRHNNTKHKATLTSLKFNLEFIHSLQAQKLGVSVYYNGVGVFTTETHKPTQIEFDCKNPVIGQGPGYRQEHAAKSKMRKTRNLNQIVITSPTFHCLSLLINRNLKSTQTDPWVGTITRRCLILEIEFAVWTPGAFWSPSQAVHSPHHLSAKFVSPMHGKWKKNVVRFSTACIQQTSAMA